MFAALENLNAPTTDEVGVDLQDEALFEASFDLLQDAPASFELERLDDTITELNHLHDTIAQHGVSMEMLAFANVGGSLTASIPAFAAIESLGAAVEADSEQAEDAKKGVLAKIKEATAAWFKRAWEMASGWGGKVAAFAKAGYDKTVAAAKWATGKVFDGARAAKEAISAHPVAAATAAAAFIAGVSALVVTLWDGELPKSADALKEWISTKSATMKEKLSDMAFYVKYYAVTGTQDAVKGVQKGTGAALGYAKEGFDKVVDATKSAFKEGGAVAHLADFFKTKLGKVFEVVKSIGTEGWRYAREAVAWLMKQTKHLWTQAPATAMRYISSVLTTFKKFFVKKTAEA